MSSSSPRIVLVHGVWDLFHAGHVEHLRQAALFGDELYVSVVPDGYCFKRKPIIPERERLAVLQAVRYVTEAFLCYGPGPEDLIQKLKPTVYVRPIDYLARNEPELEILAKLKISLGFTRPIPIHTTDIIRRIKEST